MAAMLIGRPMEHHMKVHGLILVLSLIATSFSFAQDIRSCDGSLAPTIEKTASDYALAQAYMSVNAAHEYDKLRNSSEEARGASASYKFFNAEYNDSKSADQFQEKVRDRLSKE